MSDLLCPVGGSKTMQEIAAVLGRKAGEQKPKVAVVRCNGNCEARKKTNYYDGVRSCKIEHNLYIGETGCSFGCLGGGDCERACTFDAIHINPETGLPEVDEEKCTACGACVKACPKHIIELRYKGPKNRRIFVSCVNEEKGAVARKACSNACIGCSKCVKECAFDAITVKNNLAYIDNVSGTISPEIGIGASSSGSWFEAVNTSDNANSNIAPAARKILFNVKITF